MEYQDKLFMVVRNLVEYGYYQGKPENAVKVIVKKFPTLPKEECTADLLAYVAAYQEAIHLVRKHHAYYEENNRSYIPDDEIKYKQRHPKVPEKMLNIMIGWVYHWHYER